MSEDIKVLTPDEVRANVIQDLDLDPNEDANKSVIDRVTNDRLEAQKSLSKAIEQKANYRKYAVEAGLIDPVTFEPIKKEEINKPGQAVTPEWQEKIELKTDGYNEEEVSFIQINGGKKALENPFVKTAIDMMREKRKAENAVVDVDTNKSDIEKKFTDDQLRAMPTAELEKLLPKA